MAEPIPQPQTQRPLKTWKEIAEHLGVSVRTAQLWEKERGLPVRRIEGVKGQVRASPEDLESWWQSQQRPAQPSVSAPEGASASTPNAVPALLESSGIEAPKDQRALQVEMLHLVVCCLLYSSLFVLDLFLEVAYRFNDFSHQVFVAAPLLAAWISLTAALGLWLGGRMTLRGIRGGFAALLASFVCSALIAFGAITLVLPAEPITILHTAPQTAQAAFLKNVVLYFLPLVTVVWIIPFHFVNGLRRQILSGKSSQVQMLLDGRVWARLFSPKIRAVFPAAGLGRRRRRVPARQKCNRAAALWTSRSFAAR
jgi:hypothetical protein